MFLGQLRLHRSRALPVLEIAQILLIAFFGFEPIEFELSLLSFLFGAILFFRCRQCDFSQLLLQLSLHLRVGINLVLRIRPTVRAGRVFYRVYGLILDGPGSIAGKQSDEIGQELCGNE
jgi:hypothetical protein